MQISPSILQNFDLIGFDPRGVQFSSPISCISDAQKDVLNAESPDVLTASGFAQAKQLAAQVAQECSTKYGPALAQFNTVNTARDMDLIRQAVGDDQMNYLGFSYGTQLGSTYAHLFPGKIRVAVLDGAVDPLTSGITQFADQLGGFEKAFDQFATWCHTQSPCSQLGDPRPAVYDIVAAADKHPLSANDPGETRQVTSSLVLTGVLDALKIEQADVVAHDIGNMVAFAFAAKYPQRVGRLVVIDAPVPGVGPWDEILKNPLLWHFRFGGPDMERLVAGLREDQHALARRLTGAEEVFATAFHTAPDALAITRKADGFSCR